MNPAILMKLMNAKNVFTNNHPKLEAFIKQVIMGGNGIPEGTVIELTITKPGEEPISTNIRVQQSDLEMIESLKELGRGM
ncbi:MAG: hypothetical protein IJF07_00010 [Lachnospiraceae bacterium]|nr:hypothetical protein [Lachnospiraceae bacterium]